MPTKKKRVGFIPREDVIKIIDKLSIENNLSNSKIISILVEEALSTRGLFNKTNCNESNFYNSIQANSKNLPESSAQFIDNGQFTIDTKLGDSNNHSKSTILKHTNHETFDLQTYKRFLSFLKFQEMMEKYSN